VVFLYSVSSINNQARCSIVVLTRPTSRKSQKTFYWFEITIFFGYMGMKNYITITRLKAKVKVKKGVPELKELK
jgi:hypothetical protein